MDRCRTHAARVLAPLFRYIHHHSSTSIERATLFLLGVEGERRGVPFATSFLETLSRDDLRKGSALWLGKAVCASKESVVHAAELVARGKLTRKELELIPEDNARQSLYAAAKKAGEKLEVMRKRHEEASRRFVASAPVQEVRLPLNRWKKMFRDTRKIQEAGGERVVMEWPAKHSREVFFSECCDRIRELLSSNIYTSVVATGCTVPEIAAYLGIIGVHSISADPFLNTFFSGVNIKRALVDCHFASRLLAQCGVTVRVHADKTMSLGDPFRDIHGGFAHAFLMERFFEDAGGIPELFGVSSLFSLDTPSPAGLLAACAHAQIMREAFLRGPVALSLSDRARGENLFALVAAATEQSIVTVPELMSTSLFSLLRDFGDEITLVPNGKVSRRAHTVLENTMKLLQRMEQEGIFKSLARGIMAGKEIDEDKGVGLDGVFQKDRRYWNPLLDLFVGEQGKKGDKRWLASA